ncbi:hypothetical protein DBR47_12295 [Paucibacter sp. KBW04]|nr:hypothetical protein DBR47_12295 [Paucibacter sp. KBW04]
MAITKKIIGAGAIASLAAALGGCANQSGGGGASNAFKGAIDAIGAGLAAGMSGGAPAQQGAPTATSSGKVVVINGILIAVDGERPSDPRWAGKQIKDTPLFGFFNAHPISRPGEYFPRIGIRIDDYSQSLVSDNVITKHLNASPGATPRDNECIKFTAMVWMSEKQSQRIDNVVLCSSDISSKDGYMSQGALKNYRNNAYAPVSISSMQLRTLGPREPQKLLPDFTPADVALYGSGQHLFSSLFSQLGFQGPVDGDQRLWFVNLASAAK